MRYVFGEYGLDTKRRVLDCPAGEVALRPKVYALLELLIFERDRVVPKEEIFERIWPGVYVGDATLNTCIKLARQAIGDSGELQAKIRTLHGHGYRFVAAVEERDDGPPATAAASEAAPRVTAASSSPPEPRTRADALERERKRVTVLDCAVSDAAALAFRLGEEAMDETFERFSNAAERIVRQYGGTIAQWHGDGFVALFGAPRALEDHAMRAVVAALDLRDDAEIDVVVGLHTGSVVVGPVANDPARIFTAIGATTEAARHLRLSAAANAVVASPETYAVVQGDVLAASGEAKGSAASYLIDALAAPPVHPKHEHRLLARFVGRERELGLLRDRLETAAAGDGQVVGILGEPGIGKSRLVDEFAQVAAAETQVYRGQCLAYAANSPYLPIRDLVLGFCAAERTDPMEALSDRLALLLKDFGITAPEAHAMLCQVVGIPSPDTIPFHFSPEERRTRTRSLLYDLAAHICERGPCVLIVEDIHWIDATSEAWLSGLVNRLTGMRMILVVTARTGYQAPWLVRSSVSQIALARLRPEDSEALVGSLSTAEPIGAHEIGRIVERGQGNPFFLEELTRNAASGVNDEISVPETIQAVLTTRIDQLASSDKRLLQIAAVIGADVPLTLLSRVDDLDEAERQSSLERLQVADFLQERGTTNERRVTFKHVLTQDVAYLGLVGRAREAIHRRVAAAMEAEAGGLARERPELLAHHLTESGDTERAVLYWRQAGRRASERSSEREAISHFETALSLADELPSNPSSARQRLELLLDLGVALQNVSGQGAAEVGRVYQQANDLAVEVGDTRLSFEALWGLWTHRLNRSGLESATELANRLLAIGQGIGDAETLLQARHAVWTTARFRGDLAEALEQVAHGIELHQEESSPPQFYAFGGHDPLVCALGTRAIALWLGGRSEQSAKEMANALTMAERLDHPGTKANVLVNAADLYLMGRDQSALESVAARLLDLGAMYGFDQPHAVGDFALGWCLCQAMDAAAGIAKMEEGLKAMEGLGRTYQEPYHVALIVEVAVAGGGGAPALDRLGHVLEDLEQGPVGHWAAGEAYRIYGQSMLLVGGDRTKAEEHMRKAIGICREQGALALELRAVTSLGRLLMRDGRADEARTMAEAVRARFAEGLNSPEFALASELFGPSGNLHPAR